MTTSEPSSHGLREGEIVIAAPPAADAILTFIGRIETPWTRRADCPRQGDRVAGPVCRIHLDAIWLPALDGVEAHGELQVLYWMHQARRDLVRLAPRSHGPDAHSLGDHPIRGPFALRAPTRPNPIASSMVALLGRDGTVLSVRGLDCLDGTPLLDLKPWRG